MNIVKITEKQQVVYGIIIEMSQVVLFLLILNLLNIREVLQEMLMMVKKGEANKDGNKVGKNETEIVIPLKHWSNFGKV